MPKRVQYTLDYFIKSSPAILYEFLTTPSGLSQWFAERVESSDDYQFTFYWEGFPEKATVLDFRIDDFVRFKMPSNEEGEFLEFRISKSEITDDTILIITDFADEDELSDQRQIWDRQVEELVQRVGGGN